MGTFCAESGQGWADGIYEIFVLPMQTPRLLRFFSSVRNAEIDSNEIVL